MEGHEQARSGAKDLGGITAEDPRGQDMVAGHLKLKKGSE